MTPFHINPRDVLFRFKVVGLYPQPVGLCQDTAAERFLPCSLCVAMGSLGVGHLLSMF